jgi:hypothetical protein
MGIPLFGQEHVDRYRETDGEEGDDWQGSTVLLLTTPGRNSGAKRTTPLIYQRHGDDYLVVASNGGGDPPGWCPPQPGSPGAERHDEGTQDQHHHGDQRHALPQQGTTREGSTEPEMRTKRIPIRSSTTVAWNWSTRDTSNCVWWPGPCPSRSPPADRCPRGAGANDGADHGHQGCGNPLAGRTALPGRAAAARARLLRSRPDETGADAQEELAGVKPLVAADLVAHRLKREHAEQRPDGVDQHPLELQHASQPIRGADEGEEGQHDCRPGDDENRAKNERYPPAEPEEELDRDSHADRGYGSADQDQGPNNTTIPTRQLAEQQPEAGLEQDQADGH